MAHVSIYTLTLYRFALLASRTCGLGGRSMTEEEPYFGMGRHVWRWQRYYRPHRNGNLSDGAVGT